MCQSAPRHPVYIWVGDEFWPVTAVEQRQPVDAARCLTFVNGLVGLFIFDIPQIPSGSIRICSVCVATGLFDTNIEEDIF